MADAPAALTRLTGPGSVFLLLQLPGWVIVALSAVVTVVDVTLLSCMAIGTVQPGDPYWPSGVAPTWDQQAWNCAWSFAAVVFGYLVRDVGVDLGRQLDQWMHARMKSCPDPGLGNARRAISLAVSSDASTGPRAPGPLRRN